MSDKRYYIVKNLTSLSGGVSFNNGSLNGDTYDLTKHNDDTAPTGETVTEYAEKSDVAAALDLPIFNGMGQMGPAILAKELRFCEDIANMFRAAQSSLSIAQGEVMFGELEHSSHAISRGLVNLSWSRFNQTNDAIIDLPTKAVFNAYYNAYFAKFPRNLS